MRTRRGLSSVVGMVFAIIALTSVVTYVSYSMNTLNQYNQSILSKDQTMSSQANEKFQVSNVNLAGNKLNVTIVNTGTVPVNITKIWVQNTTAFGQGTDWTISYSPSNKFAGPGATITNIGQQIPGVIYNTKGYHVKLVTSRGSTQEFNVNSGTTTPIFMQLNALPRIVPPGFTTSVLLSVINNQSSNNVLLNLQPTLQISGISNDASCGTATPTQFASLQPGEAITFRWVCTINGNSGDTITFTGSLANGLGANSATDTITVQNVQFASQSSTSLQTQGLVCCKTNDEYLILHQETTDTPTNGGNNFQMYSGSVDNTAGKTLPLTYGSAYKALFYTQNDSSSETLIPGAGQWTISFLYNSRAVPTSLQSNLPDMIFHFNQQPTQGALSQLVQTTSLTDSSGLGNTLTASNPQPSWSSSCTRDSSGCYTFSGSGTQYLKVALNSNSPGGNNIGQNTVSMAGWIKPTAYPAAEGVIYRIDAGLASNYFDIGLESSKKLQFQFLTTGASVVTCTSSANIGLNDWTFFVAERTNYDTCVLYINGSGTSTTSSGTFHNHDTITPTSAGYIGASPEGINGFTGSIDYLMYWNNYVLTTTDIGTSATDGLYAKNYGPNAHLINIKVDETDKNGNLYKPIFANSTFALPFIDSAGRTGASSWGYYNFTMGHNVWNSTDANGNWYIDPNYRMRLNVTWTGGPSNDDMNWRIDDVTIPNNIFSSFMQVPPLPTSFPSYFAYSISNGLNVQVTNQGPLGVWLIGSGTRAVFQTLTEGSGNSYAGLPWQAISNLGTATISPSQDSFYVPLFQTVNLYFSQPNLDPCYATGKSGGCNSQTAITSGSHYRLYVTLVGYDDSGNEVFKSYYVGMVKVIP